MARGVVLAGCIGSRQAHTDVEGCMWWYSWHRCWHKRQLLLNTHPMSVEEGLLGPHLLA